MNGFKQDFSPVEDMTTLFDLTEASLLQNLEMRYNHKHIYTYTGSILVSVNPYELLPLYTPEVVKQYFGKQRGSLPPHIFAIADSAYTSMTEEHKNQSVIISGESGAGKTEATKLIIQYLASRTNKHSEIEQMIVESSPILEAFGNAKTVRNNNSSRFGKYIEIHFNKSGYICGARIIQYLLEKSRIAFQAPSERNYHVFYQLCAGASADLKQKLKLGAPSSYHYLNQSGCIEIENVDDAEDFNAMKSAMEFLGLNETQQEPIFRILGAVLHLGNIQFKTHEHTKGAEGSIVSTKEELEISAELLQIDAANLAKALTFRHVLIRGQNFVIPLKAFEAADARDALAKALYDKTFQWLVTYINSRITKPDPSGQAPRFIGVLDIFGFENFKVNSFEQFCINYCNEKLQQHFNQHIFKLEQEEYEREKINWSKITFNDNQECLDLIEKRPLGILSLLDEECKFPKATDLTLLEKLHANHEKHPYYEKPRLTKTNFILRHYAGEVSYETKGYLDKNKDTLQDDLLGVLVISKDKFISTMFSGLSVKPCEVLRRSPSGKYLPSADKLRKFKQILISKDKEEDDEKKGKKKTAETVGAQFKGQLSALMSTLSATCPHFVRCIKPNTLKQANNFDREIVLAQLRYAGMMETIRIRRMGYPVRYTHQEFQDRYRVLNSRKFVHAHNPSAQVIAPAKNAATRAICEAVIANVGHIPTIIPDDWLLGLTKVFIRDTQYRALEELRNKVITEHVRRIQSVWRMYRATKLFQRMRRAAVCLQTAIVKSFARKEYLLQKHSICIIQAFAKMLKARKHFRNVRALFLVVQTGVRAALARKQYAKAVAQAKERKRRLLEIQEREKSDAERAKREREEEEQRQKQEIADKIEADKQKQVAEKKRLETEERKKKDAADKKKMEEKKQELKELGQLDDMASLQDMLKAQELNNLNELNDLVGSMENIGGPFSFEKAGKDGGDYVYSPANYANYQDSLDSLNLADLLLGLKMTVHAAHKIELDDTKFKLAPEVERELTKGRETSQTNKTAAAPAASAPAAVPAKKAANLIAAKPSTPTAIPSTPLSIPTPTSRRAADGSPLPLPNLPPPPSNLPPPPSNLPPPPSTLPPPANIPLPGMTKSPSNPPQRSLPPTRTPPAIPNMPLPPPLSPTDLPLPPPLGSLPSPPANLPPPPVFSNLPPPPLSFPPPLIIPSVPSPTSVPSSPTLPPPPPIPDSDLEDQTTLQTVASRGLVEDEEISLFLFKDFASKNFRQNPKKKKPENDHTYSKSILKTSLLTLDADKTKVAVEIASKIYAYAGSKKQAAGASAEQFAGPQYILQKGLAVEELRDEIYSQLIRQTIENPSRDLVVKYWELIVFCAATFLPTPKLIKYVGSHLQVQKDTEGSSGSIASLAQLAIKNLLRLRTNGPRKFVPSVVELEALRDCRPIVIKIHLADGTIKSFIIDSASTVLEVSDSLSDKLLMRPDSKQNGFTVVEVFNNIERDLNPEDKLADSLSKFENLQVAMKEQKMSVTAKLVFKKRLFLSRELDNQMERELAFHQTVSDLLMGVLPCPEEEVVALAALKLQCDCGDYTDDTPSWLLGEVHNYLPPRLLKNSTDDLLNQYMELRGAAKEDAKRALYDTVTQMPLYGYSVFIVSHQNPGISIPSNFLIAVDITGMHIVEKSTQRILQSFAFTQLGQCKATPRSLLLTWDGGQKSLDIQTSEGHRIMALLRDYLAILRATAKYARALRDYFVTDDNLLPFRKGDIITIRDRDEANQWYIGECDGREGSFPADHVELLPGDTPPTGAASTGVPPSQAAAALSSGAATARRNLTLKKNTAATQSDDESPSPAPTPRELPAVPSTIRGDTSKLAGELLQTFAKNKFRKVPVKKGQRGDGTQGLTFTKDPIKDSLIDLDSKNSKKACNVFQSVMAYMEDYPPPGKLSRNALAQNVVQMGIETHELRDEIFCQIFKQSSGNPRPESAKKGNELLVICAAIFAPSQALLPALIESLTLRSDAVPLAKSAIDWLTKTAGIPAGTGRKQAPCARELESLRNMEDSMICKVLMPDKSNKAIFVNSYTTVRDAFTDLANRIDLTLHLKHFSLFEVDEQQETAQPLPDNQYICDILTTFDREKPSCKIALRRRVFNEDPDKIIDQESLWTADPVAFELTFNQVREDVLKGKYYIAEKDVPYAAALLVQIRHPNSTKAPLTKDTISLFIPQAIQGAKSLKNWISAIEIHLFEVVGQTADFTKLAFLRVAATSPVFGSVLFPTFHKEHSSKVLLGISRRGVAIYDFGTQGEVGVGDPKSVWPFSAIASMTPGADASSVVLVTGNLMKPVKNSFIVENIYGLQQLYSAYTEPR